MITESLIRKLAEEKTNGTAIFVLDVNIRKGNRIMVTLDGDKGVTIDDCVMVSRYVEHQLDRDQEDFELQVSSGGADQPLKIARQYPQHIGRTLTVKLKNGEESGGILRQVETENIILEKVPEKTKKKIKIVEEPQNVSIPFAEIKESVIVITF